MLTTRRMVNTAIFVMVTSLLLVGCDTAHSTQTGQVTSVSPSSVCVNPEDDEKEPYCLAVSQPEQVAGLSGQSCVRVVGTLDRKLVRLDVLDRPCRVPRR
jgi:uncharacterized lipoprotein YajG